MNNSDIGQFIAEYDPPFDPDFKNRQYLPEERHRPYALSDDDRRRHLYIVGQTGSGKSTLLRNLIASHLRQGAGFAFIDPHGDDARAVLSLCPRARAHQVRYINPADTELPVAWNPLSGIALKDRPLVTDNIVSAFKHVYGDQWGIRLERILRNGIRLCLDIEGATFLTMMRLLTDEAYRSRVVPKATDPVVRAFWAVEFEGWDKRLKGEAVGPVLTRIEAFLTPAVRGILCHPTSSIDLRQTMDEGRILIVNLSKGSIGEQNAYMLGALIVSGITQAAFGRSAVPDEDRRLFHLYVDEFQNFAGGAFSLILSEARKYGLTLTLAHQLLGQIPEPLRHAVFGNVGSIVSFRVGAEDAETICSQMGMKDPTVLSQLPNYSAWGRFLRGGEMTRPMLLRTSRPPVPTGDRSEQIIRNSRARFGRNGEALEQWIARNLPQFPHEKKRKNRKARW